MTLVHFLDAGLPACGFAVVPPRDWPPGHVWIDLRETKPNLPEGHTYCPDCLRIWRRARSTPKP